jgi:hypothetical protein
MAFFRQRSTTLESSGAPARRRNRVKRFQRLKHVRDVTETRARIGGRRANSSSKMPRIEGIRCLGGTGPLRLGPLALVEERRGLDEVQEAQVVAPGPEPGDGARVGDPDRAERALHVPVESQERFRLGRLDRLESAAEVSRKTAGPSTSITVVRVFPVRGPLIGTPRTSFLRDCSVRSE